MVSKQQLSRPGWDGDGEHGGRRWWCVEGRGWGVHSVTLQIMMHYRNIRSNELKDGKSKKRG